MKKTLFVVALVVMSLVSFVSCEKDSATDSKSNSEESVKESIVGFWLGENNLVYVFYADGSFSLFSGERGHGSGTSGGSFSGTSGGSFSGTSGGSFSGDYGYELFTGYWKYDKDKERVTVDMYDIPYGYYHIQCEVIDITSKSLTIVYEGNERVRCYKMK